MLTKTKRMYNMCSMRLQREHNISMPFLPINRFWVGDKKGGMTGKWGGGKGQGE